MGLGWTPPTEKPKPSYKTREGGKPRVEKVGGKTRAYAPAKGSESPWGNDSILGSPGVYIPPNFNPDGGARAGGSGGARSPGGGGVPYTPPGAAGPTEFRTDSTDNMSEVMQMYRDLLSKNEALSGEFDIEDLMNKQRAEGSIQRKEADAFAERKGGMSAAEIRNMNMDQSRNLAGMRGDAERSKLDFERGLLQDMTGAIGGASGLAGEEGRFLNQARQNEIDVWRTQVDYPLRLQEITSRAEANRASALAQLAALV